MERKNTMLLTVIAVATLLVAVVGATFAYYSVQSGANNSTTAINTTTGKAATVTYTAGTSQLYLNVRSAQMANTAQGTYYAQATDIDASSTSTDYTLGTFTVTGAGDTDVHECTFDWSLQTSGALKNLADNTTNGRITISLGNDTSDTGAITPVGTPALVGDKAFSTTATSGSAKFRATGNQAMTIHGTASITNTDTVQNTPSTNDISDLSGVVTTFQVTNVVCTAVSGS